MNRAVFVAGIDLAAGRGRFPGRGLTGCFGNRPGALLHTGARDAIPADTRRILREAGRGGIILGEDCSLPRDIDNRRIRRVIEALEG